MDTIREYLNNLFMGFPETPAVLRAKAELLEMMEDKYEECLSEGKSEKEAVGIVISEFGNIEELSEELGIADYLQEKQESATKEEEPAKESEHGFQGDEENRAWGAGAQKIPAEEWSFSQAHQFVTYAWKHAFMLAGGVACFILSCFLGGICDTLADDTFLPNVLMDSLGSFVFIAGVTAGVLLLVFKGRLEKTYPVVRKRRRILVDAETADYMKKQRVSDEEKCFRMRLAGILLLVFMWVPAALSEILFGFFELLVDFAGNSTLLWIAAGVFLIVASVSVENRYQEFARAAVSDGDAAFSSDGVSDTWQNDNVDNMVFTGYQKKKRGWVPVLIIIAVFCTILCITIRGAVALFSVTKSGYTVLQDMVDENSKKIEEHKTYSLNEVNDIQIDLDTDDVLVQSGNVEKIMLDYKGNRKIKENLADGVLEIKERGHSGWIQIHLFDFAFGNHGNLVLTLPKSLYGSVESFRGKRKISIDTDTGDIQMKEVCFSGISVDADTGNVTLSKAAGVESGISIDADTGNIQLDDVIGEKILLDADTGNVTVTVSERDFFGSLECDLDTGDFLLKVPMGKEGFLETFAPDFSVGLGDSVQFFGEKVKENEISEKTQGGKRPIKVSVDVGNITVEGR